MAALFDEARAPARPGPCCRRSCLNSCASVRAGDGNLADLLGFDGARTKAVELDGNMAPLVMERPENRGAIMAI